MTIKDLKIGENARILKVGGEGALRQHFLDMGVIPGAEVTLVKRAPLDDPLELQIHGYKLALRLADAAVIEVEKISERSNKHEHSRSFSREEHPGLGEEGRYHDRSTEDPLPDGTVLTFALVGNQNSGKTTLFNQLTGSNQHVGNFPGVTVDRKDGVIKGHPDTLITDLPGIYSMSPYSPEEIVSRNFVLQEKPKAVINIVDAMNIERNLYLSMQLLEMRIPMVIALNMMDEVSGNFIHHVQGDDHRDPHLQQLHAKIQVAFDIHRIHDVDDGLRLFLQYEIAGDDLFWRVRRHRIDPRKIGDQRIRMALDDAVLTVHRDAREVADVLIGTGQLVEQGRLAAVLVSDQRKGQDCSVGKRIFRRSVVISSLFSQSGMFFPGERTGMLVLVAALGDLFNFDHRCIRQTQSQLVAVDLQFQRIIQRSAFYKSDLRSGNDSHVQKVLTKSSLSPDFQDPGVLTYL